MRACRVGGNNILVFGLDNKKMETVHVLQVDPYEMLYVVLLRVPVCASCKMAD